MDGYKLIVSDLDGTLLHNDMSLSEENKRAIQRFNELGITFVASSGRTLYEIPESIRKNPNIRYISYSNGTAIFDKHVGRDIYSKRISNDITKKVMDILAKYEVYLSVHYDGYSHIDKDRTTPELLRYYQINDYYSTLLLKSVPVADFNNAVKEIKEIEAFVIFFHDDKELLECKELLNKIDGLTVTSSIGHNIELCSGEAGKGAALAALADMLNIKREETISIGDNMNDTSMFKVSGLSLCTSNGNEKAKLLADKVICSNEENTAEYVLLHLIK